MVLLKLRSADNLSKKETMNKPPSFFFLKWTNYSGGSPIVVADLNNEANHDVDDEEQERKTKQIISFLCMRERCLLM